MNNSKEVEREQKWMEVNDSWESHDESTGKSKLKKHNV